MRSSKRIINKQIKSIVLYFGAFDMFHYAHKEMIQKTQELLGSETPVHLILAANKFTQKPYDCDDLIATQKNVLASYEDRCAMIKMQIKDLKNVFLSDCEINLANLKKTQIYSHEILEIYQQQYPCAQFYLIMGTDNLISFTTWRKYQTLLSQTKIIGFKRLGLCVNQQCKNACSCENYLLDNVNIPLYDLKYNAVSSSAIKTSFNWVDQMDKEAFDYLLNNGLYGVFLLEKHVVKTKKNVTEIDYKRIKHSFAVAKLCAEIMQKYDPLQTRRAYVAGLYHDLLKPLNEKMTNDFYATYSADLTELPWTIKHGSNAAFLLYFQYHFTDYEILDAIIRHTKPHLYTDNLTLLDKVLFVADKIEPHRTIDDHPNLHALRSLVYTDLDQVFEEIDQYQDQCFGKIKLPNNEFLQVINYGAKEKSQK
ncbi:bis(5'-nucleosyl)-tetraphosphatase (symmetrical) YqeK [Ureaplasma miroungigenitalium]|uniref:Bis(5'-nucleosyl)-tetraphosphatase (Symmetrical) YqeK n=1 Tax=Ureaplasma miroungigenitalium TaxID=1042321 RepID=A0ABT3BLQ4_9BACT|nr:bis(5'-nucleosyl)-tetraphosphatase (symmetrical) YqeK [Ureaplasma miroungigenitalium]MCV3728198.1 bis(5'-nucleosyl)-tetraphosphatase (symmetrical) YqeK [Ureaplasma miroungigenitalium]